MGISVGIFDRRDGVAPQDSPTSGSATSSKSVGVVSVGDAPRLVEFNRPFELSKPDESGIPVAMAGESAGTVTVTGGDVTVTKYQNQ